jgi:hypothetical protein
LITLAILGVGTISINLFGDYNHLWDRFARRENKLAAGSWSVAVSKMSGVHCRAHHSRLMVAEIW